MQHIRLTLIGFGVVGQSFAELLANKHAYLKQRYSTWLTLVGVDNARHGFIYRTDGLNLSLLLQFAREGRPLTEYHDVRHWNNAVDGLKDTVADILIEASPTNLRDAEPALSHIRTALSKRMHAVTANKGPGALAASELFTLAREHGVQFRMESSVMAGTPVISTIREGMAGAKNTSPRRSPQRTTNHIFSATASPPRHAAAVPPPPAPGH